MKFRWLSGLKIQHKIILIVMVTCMASLAITGMSLLGFVRHVSRSTILHGLSTDTRIIASQCDVALAFNNKNDVKKVLRALESNKSVMFGGVYTNEGELFAVYYRKDTDKSVTAELTKGRDYYFGEKSLTVFHDIEHDGDKIGTLVVRSDLRQLQIVLRKSFWVILLVILLALALAFPLSAKFQRLISQPILNLSEVAMRIKINNDFSIRAHNKSDDEVGCLIESFNQMVEQIQQRDTELVNSNKQLKKEAEERKLAEKSLEILNHKLEQMVNKLSESNKELQDFVHVASHDLREPLRTISSFGILLGDSLKGKLNEDDCENLQFMIDGASRMTQMVEAILFYSRIGTKDIQFNNIDLNEAVKELKELELAALLEETGGTILVPDSLPLINGDSTQVIQLLQNLIGNALKYHKPQIVPEVCIRVDKIVDNMVRIEIADNGIGIKEEYYKDVFTMFRRLHPRESYEGAGIGLSVCKKIVERHGGEIGICSELEKGTKFWFTLQAANIVEVAKNEQEYEEVLKTS